MLAGMAVVDVTDDLVIPAPASLETRIHGVPKGYWYNFVQWSDDSKHLSFTIRTSGVMAGSVPCHSQRDFACTCPILLCTHIALDKSRAVLCTGCD